MDKDVMESGQYNVSNPRSDCMTELAVMEVKACLSIGGVVCIALLETTTTAPTALRTAEMKDYPGNWRRNGVFF